MNFKTGLSIAEVKLCDGCWLLTPDSTSESGQGCGVCKIYANSHRQEAINYTLGIKEGAKKVSNYCPRSSIDKIVPLLYRYRGEINASNAGLDDTCGKCERIFKDAIGKAVSCRLAQTLLFGLRDEAISAAAFNANNAKLIDRKCPLMPVIINISQIPSRVSDGAV